MAFRPNESSSEGSTGGGTEGSSVEHSGDCRVRVRCFEDSLESSGDYLCSSDESKDRRSALPLPGVLVLLVGESPSSGSHSRFASNPRGGVRAVAATLVVCIVRVEMPLRSSAPPVPHDGHSQRLVLLLGRRRQEGAQRVVPGARRLSRRHRGGPLAVTSMARGRRRRRRRLPRFRRNANPPLVRQRGTGARGPPPRTATPFRRQHRLLPSRRLLGPRQDRREALSSIPPGGRHGLREGRLLDLAAYAVPPPLVGSAGVVPFPRKTTDTKEHTTPNGRQGRGVLGAMTDGWLPRPAGHPASGRARPFFKIGPVPLSWPRQADTSACSSSCRRFGGRGVCSSVLLLR
mmetsp:Transcript_5941/g.13069  ORF Transcript_5941/g.13069 Transcript_5941/m.13069 type:complete len:346 (+) Transcript_5941:653-1690(+)